jgi:hypothetical protein
MRGGRDLAGALAGGLILILLGSLLYLGQNNFLSLTASNWWTFFIMGLGIIVIVLGLVRYGQRGYFMGSFIGGAVLISIGLTGVVSSLSNVWPLIIVVLGFAVLAVAITGRGRVLSRAEGEASKS